MLNVKAVGARASAGVAGPANHLYDAAELAGATDTRWRGWVVERADCEHLDVLGWQRPAQVERAIGVDHNRCRQRDIDLAIEEDVDQRVRAGATSNLNSREIVAGRRAGDGWSLRPVIRVVQEVVATSNACICEANQRTGKWVTDGDIARGAAGIGRDGDGGSADAAVGIAGLTDSIADPCAAAVNGDVHRAIDVAAMDNRIWPVDSDGCAPRVGA